MNVYKHSYFSFFKTLSINDLKKRASRNPLPVE